MRAVRAAARPWNDVGLLAEEYGAGQKRLCGNFPQAFSHVALLNTAFNLARAGQQSTPMPVVQRGRAHSNPQSSATD